MFRSVEIPIWFLALLVLFAAVTFASHFLFPSVRWYFRRRMEKVVAQLNERLERPIEPFKLARRHDMIQRLIYDPKVAAAIAEHAAEEDVPEAVAFERAQRYAKEIVPSFSASMYFGFAMRLSKWLSTKLYTVHLNDAEGGALSKIDNDATVIFVMNHRSNMDYVLVPYLVADQSALSYAVGEWARVWPLSRLIRALGAFFIRRKSRNTLYRRVLARYVQMATKGGVTQAVFPEGGLSLDGAMAQPKLGLLSYILSDFDPSDDGDVVFVPVALNYDRVIEDRVLTEAAERGERKFRASIMTGIFFALRYGWRRLRRTAVRFGHAGVTIGTPVSLKSLLVDVKNDRIQEVGKALRHHIKSAIPLLPIPATAFALTKQGGKAELADLTVAVAQLIEKAPHPSLKSAEKVVSNAITHMKTRRMVQENGTQVEVMPENKMLVDFYAKSVEHLF